MFIRTLEDLAASSLVMSLLNGTFRSARFLTAADGMGFSYNDNHVTRGTNATKSAGTGAVEVPVLPTIDAGGGAGWDPISMLSLFPLPSVGVSVGARSQGR